MLSGHVSVVHVLLYAHWYHIQWYSIPNQPFYISKQPTPPCQAVIIWHNAGNIFSCNAFMRDFRRPNLNNKRTLFNNGCLSLEGCPLSGWTRSKFHGPIVLHKLINWLKCPCSALVELHSHWLSTGESTAQHRWSEMLLASNFVVRVFTGIKRQISYILGWTAAGGDWKFYAAESFPWQSVLIIHSLKNYLPTSFCSRHRMFAGTIQHRWHHSAP